YAASALVVATPAGLLGKRCSRENVELAPRAGCSAMEQPEQLNQHVMRLALATNSARTGKHGVDLHKISPIGEEFGEAGVDLMRRTKATRDPMNILNLGKTVRTR